VPDTSGSIDLSSLSDEEQEAVEELARRNGESPSEAGAPQAQKVLTAFLVVVGLDGNPTPMAFNDPQFDILTQATPDLIHAFCGTVRKDIEAMESAQATAEVMQQQAMALQQQMQDQMLQRQVAQGLKAGAR
jgi:hypothetical protein